MITITEKYALCMLKEKKSLYAEELKTHLIVSMIVEMMLNDNLEITSQNNVKLKVNIPREEYNIKLYEIIKKLITDSKKEQVSMKNILNYTIYGFTTKNIREIVEALKQKMIEDNLIAIENKKGFLGTKEAIIVQEDKFTNIIEEIRAEILEKGKLTEDSILLASLLNSTNFLKNSFIKYERETLNKRLKEIETTKIAEKVKIAKQIIDDTAIMITAIITSTMN